MLKNYLNIVLRGIWKYKTFSAINILGLAIGITCCLLILLFVQYELSYDRYHDNLNRIYRISLHGVVAGSEIKIYRAAVGEVHDVCFAGAGGGVSLVVAAFLQEVL